jgi:vacuolar-type H+-ATPase subunit H
VRDRIAGPSGALAQLLETERRLERLVADAASQAEAMVAEAESAAAVRLASAEEDIGTWSGHRGRPRKPTAP